MSNNDSSKEQAQIRDGHRQWERPELRRLAANEAQGGGNPGNDGSGQGQGSTGQHS